MFGLDIGHFLLIFAVAVLGVSHYLQSRKGEPIFESLRDKALPLAAKLKKYGLEDIAAPFDEVTRFGEHMILDRLHTLANNLNDEEWFDEHIAAKLIGSVGRRVFDNDSLRMVIEAKLQGSGWAIVPAERLRSLRRPGIGTTARGEERIADHVVEDTRDFSSREIATQQGGARLRQTRTDEHNIDLPARGD